MGEEGKQYIDVGGWMMGAMVGEEVVHEGDVDVDFADAVAGSEAGLGGGAEAGATCSRPKQLPWMGHS